MNKRQRKKWRQQQGERRRQRFGRLQKSLADVGPCVVRMGMAANRAAQRAQKALRGVAEAAAAGVPLLDALAEFKTPNDKGRSTSIGHR